MITATQNHIASRADMLRRCGALFSLAMLVLLATGDAAHAHTGTGLAGGLVSGFLHPLNGADHLLAMVAVGIWGAFLGRPLVIVLPIAFPIMMAVGGVLGIAGVPMPPVEVGIAISVIVLGGLIAGAVRLPVWAAVPIVAVFALFHGYAHGQELPSAADPFGYSIGFMTATGLLHVVGIGIGFLNEKSGGVMVTRIIGGLIALAGVYFMTNVLKA